MLRMSNMSITTEKTMNHNPSKKISGKPFIVKESLQQLSWQITSEVREISGYTCRKAYLDDPKGEQKKVSVWFTEEIPVSSGPISFYGLPGIDLVGQRW